MSTEATTRMLAPFIKKSTPTGFLSSYFQSPKKNFYNTEAVEIDIKRGGRSIAIAIADLSTGYHMNSVDLYTNKKFIPPIFSEAFSLNSYDTLKRVPGDDPFKDPKLLASAMFQFMDSMEAVENMIRRTIELQASQIFQTGVVDLKDSAGITRYTIDYKAKATHFPTASNPWDGASATIAKDIGDLCEVIADDGLVDVEDSFCQGSLFEIMLKDDDFRARFDTRRTDLGEIKLMLPGDQESAQGARYRGILNINNYPLRLFTYNGRYTDPQTGVETKYLNRKKFTVLARSRYDATFGNVPSVVAPSQRVLPYLRRISRGGMDMIPNAWVSADGKHLFGGVDSRPLLIPTDIDAFGSIDSDIT